MHEGKTQRSDDSRQTATPDPVEPAYPARLVGHADNALATFRTLCGRDVLTGMCGRDVLDERMAITGRRPRDGMSHSGDCRLLPCADAMLGVNLPREDDWELLPALLQEAGDWQWDSLARCIASKPAAPLVARARELGLAIVDATAAPTLADDWLLRTTCGEPALRNGPPRVIDLSSLWAGPLCSRLWQAAGAEVIKVEGSQRPDGARRGSAAFFQRLNAGKQSLQLDLHRESGRRELRALLHSADIVLEASRPRALRQMGLVAEEIIAARPGLTWVSITGYGRAEPQGNWIAYGDDAAIAAGLSAQVFRSSGEWRVVGDAIADPLTGLHAAVVGWRSWLAGGGELLDVALARTVRHCLASDAAPGDAKP
ncbi:CoA transferase [Mangrovimicrobium sediminis]|nr:CoA transferase [Haliea sp. SAOS-164]